MLSICVWWPSLGVQLFMVLFVPRMEQRFMRDEQPCCSADSAAREEIALRAGGRGGRSDYGGRGGGRGAHLRRWPSMSALTVIARQVFVAHHVHIFEMHMTLVPLMFTCTLV